MKTGNVIIQTGNVIISPIFWFPMKKLLLKMVLSSNNDTKTENGIIQTGNGIISPTSWPLAKNHILQNVSNFN